MDTSEEYVKMCRTAHKIQEERNSISLYLKMDLVAELDNNNKVLRTFFTTIDKFPEMTIRKSEGNIHYVWLPAQDQLQELMPEMFSAVGVVRYVNDFLYPHEIRPNTEARELGMWRRSVFKTLEQAWLGTLIHERYHRNWNGSEWVKA